jgi:signal transduction histidine kinase
MRPWQHKESIDMDTNKSALPSQWLYYLIGIIGGLIALSLWYASVLQSNANLDHIIELQAEHVANDIKIQFELRISALKHMAKHLEEGPELSHADWQNNVLEFVNNYGEFKAVALLNPSLKPLLMFPSNSQAIDGLYRQLIDQYANNFNQVPAMDAWISPAIADTDGRKNIFMVVPIITPNAHVKNYLASMIDLENTLNLQLSHDDYLITISANDQIIYKDNPAIPVHQSSAKEIGLDIYGAKWKIYVQPSAHLVSVVKTDLPNIALLLGISIAILFIVATRLAQLARQRAKSLDQINHDLKIEIADRIMAEESKQKLEIELLQGQKLQAIGTLAGGIAHDFNNILYAVMGYVEMARDDVEKDSLVYNNLGKVLEASHRGQELIARILAFSRRQHHEFKPIAIKSTIESVLSLLKPTIPASVVIDFKDTLEDDFTILGDQTRLHQIIVNLINNAVDAMDGEGTVTIKLSLVPSDDELLQQFPDIRHCKYCRIDLSDTGHGMDQSTIARIFEPFFTTKEVGKGTGLGLATVHTTVKEHHGEILVTSQLGLGTAFIILLPEYKIGE